MSERELLETLTDDELIAGSPLEPDSLAKYCPHTPWPKQQAFLDLECLEAFYGGGAGPGKTDALLMAALQYVHVPGYAALLLRRDFPRLNLPGAIMDRSREWLTNTDAKWNGSDHAFRFPSGATLQFGYIDNPQDRFRYASSEFQFIGWDELTEFRLGEDESNPYQFMFSRLRKTTDIPVPLRVRSASNPGNIGHVWVKNRFITQEAIDSLMRDEVRTFYADPEKTIAFVPALLKDNPSVNADEYTQSLMHLPPVTRQRLLRGDWSVVEAAIIDTTWFRYYSMRGELLEALDKNRELQPEMEIHDIECQRFCTIDTAGTSKDKAKESKGKPPSWSVCLIWDYWPSAKLLFLRHAWRDRVAWNGLKAGLRGVISEWQPRHGNMTICIENGHIGPQLSIELGDLGITNLMSTKIRKTGLNAKYERAVGSGFLSKLERGQIYFPDMRTVPGCNNWLPDLEGELMSFTGMEDETADQLDCCSYAVQYADRPANSSTIKLDFDPRVSVAVNGRRMRGF